jgi:hypothetical protein
MCLNFWQLCVGVAVSGVPHQQSTGQHPYYTQYAVYADKTSQTTQIKDYSTTTVIKKDIQRRKANSGHKLPKQKLKNQKL